ncbi:MAG: hypothetical protein V5A39_13140 [Haloarculaceae archaeon]
MVCVEIVTRVEFTEVCQSAKTDSDRGEPASERQRRPDFESVLCDFSCSCPGEEDAGCYFGVRLQKRVGSAEKQGKRFLRSASFVVFCVATSRTGNGLEPTAFHVKSPHHIVARDGDVINFGVHVSTLCTSSRFIDEFRDIDILAIIPYNQFFIG